MRQIRQASNQTEGLRGLYRTLGLSEQPLERAIKATKQQPDTKRKANLPPTLPRLKKATGVRI